MCGLCGVLGSEDHWTDGAGNAGVLADATRTRRHERLHRVALANKVLAHYGLKLSDWQGSGYVLTTRTGRTAMVGHLGALWPAAARLSPRPCDPLDGALIAALERGL
jgi:hypothetical protein